MRAAPFRSLSREHGLTVHQTTAYVLWGFIDQPGAPPSGQPIKKLLEESRDSFVNRVLTEYPALTTREEALRFRAVLGHLQLQQKAKHTEERYWQAVSILQSEGVARVNVDNIHDLIGGDTKTIARFVRLSVRGLQDGCPSHLAVMQSLAVYPDQFQAMIDMGLLDELREGSPTHGSPIDLAALPDFLPARFAAMPACEMGIERIRRYLQARRGLKLETDADHPPAFLEGVVDMLVRLKQPATVDALKFLIGGNLQQIKDYLRTRARQRGDVPIPKRNVRRNGELSDLRDDAPDELRHAWNTALDKRKSSMIAPPAVDVARILGVAHAQIHPISIVVSLHGRQHARFKRKVARALVALANLAPRLFGLDVTDDIDLRAGFTAIRLLEDKGDRFDKRQVNDDLACWRFAVEIFNDYRGQENLPDDLKAYLDGIAPVLPAGAEGFYRDVLDDLDTFNRASKAGRIKRLAPMLNDTRAFVATVFHERARFKAYHASVMQTLARARKKCGAGRLIEAEGRHFEVLPHPSGTGEIRQTYTYVVRHWRTVAGKLKAYDAKREKFCDMKGNAFPKTGWRSRLFENNFVVEHVSCKSDTEGGASEPMSWIGFQVHRAYWQPLDCHDDETHRDRCDFIAQKGFTDSILRSHGRGMGDFEDLKKGYARRARQSFGMVLLPLEEANHSQLVGLVNISTRLDEPVRTGEITQFNIGAGLTTGYTADGKPFSVFNAIPKYSKVNRRYVVSEATEDVIDELLQVASTRLYGGKGIKTGTAAASKLRKGSLTEAHLFSNGERPLVPEAINLASRLLIAGCYDLRGHDLKYVWARLEKLAGRTIEQRQTGHGHAIPATTISYDVETDDEEAQNDRTMHEANMARRDYLDGRTESVIVATGLKKLERARLLALTMIRFHAEVDELDAVEREKIALRVIEAKISALSQ